MQYAGCNPRNGYCVYTEAKGLLHVSSEFFINALFYCPRLPTGEAVGERPLQPLHIMIPHGGVCVNIPTQAI